MLDRKLHKTAPDCSRSCLEAGTTASKNRPIWKLLPLMYYPLDRKSRFSFSTPSPVPRQFASEVTILKRSSCLTLKFGPAEDAARTASLPVSYDPNQKKCSRKPGPWFVQLSANYCEILRN